MKNRSYQKAGFILSLAIVGNLTAGCRGDLSAGSGTSSSTTGATTVGGAVNQVASTDAFKVLVDFPDASNTYNYFIHSQGAAFSTGSCSVAPGTTTPNNDIYCFVDVDELDLYLKGASLRFNAPDGMCRYTKVRLYHYWGAQPGTVPGGTTCTVVTNKDTGAVTQSCTLGSNLNWNGASYVCQFDYSGGGGPNCCEGSYTLITGSTATPAGGGAPVTTYDSPTTVAMTGSIASCLSGPGKTVSGYQDKFGYPRAVYYDSTAGRNTRLDFISPADAQKVSIISVANFWDPLDFNRSTTEVSSATPFPPLASNDIPKGLQAALGYLPTPYYEFGCVDGADDYVARIRVIIRGWDSVAGFNANANPYTDPTTHEPGFNSDYYVHDRSVWGDYAVTPTHSNQPTSDIYPGIDH